MTFAILDGNRMWKTMRGARLVGLGASRHPFGDDLLAAPRAWPPMTPQTGSPSSILYGYPSSLCALCLFAPLRLKTTLRASA